MSEGTEEYLEKALSAAFTLDDDGIPIPSSPPSKPSQVTRIPDRVGRYAVEGLVGRGGMGLILQVRDAEIGRTVALKIIHEHLANDGEMLARFAEEARVCGRLEHPGVVPVHEMGTAEDGRPYFTMKLVEGRSLAAALAERRSPSDDRIGFISVFEKICQIVAYAHDRGLVHLDLKPGNVLVGGFGEILVTDWGISSETGSPADTSAAGPKSRIVGTPAYMSPEQARGDLPRIGPPSDVFALGAILCEILTGTPPYEGDTSSAILLAASRGWLEDAWRRLDDTGADPELVALAKRCLSTIPVGRPENAGQVATEVNGYLRSLEVRAHAHAIEAAAARARAAAERRQRRLQLLVGAAIVAAVIVSAGAWLLVERDRAERARADDRLAVGMAERAEILADRARNSEEPDPELWDPPAATARQALELAKARGLSADLVARLETLSAQTNAAREATLRDRQTIEDLRSIHEHIGDLRDASARDRDYGEIFRRSGIDVEALGVDEAARRILASPLRWHFMRALDHWAYAHRMVGAGSAANLDAIANQVDPATWRVRIRSAVAAGDAQAIMDLAASPERLAEPPESHVLLATSLKRFGKFEAATAALEDAERRHAGDYDIHHELGILYRSAIKPRLPEAIRQFAMAFALRPRSAHAAVDLGQALLQADELAAAESYLLQAERLDPKYAPTFLYLGTIRLHTGDAAGAEELTRRSLALDPDSSAVALALGSLLMRTGKPREAVTALRDCLARDPDLAEAWCDLGHALVTSGEFEEARKCYEKCHALGTARGARWTRPSAHWLEDIERLIEAGSDLADIGADFPKDLDPIALAALARAAWFTGRHLTAARCFEAILSDHENPASNSIEIRMLAARSAASVGTGGGKEPVEPGEAARLRRQARSIADGILESAADLPETTAVAAKKALFAGMLLDPALAGVRDAAALERLPEDERGSWSAFWTKVRRLAAERASR